MNKNKIRTTKNRLAKKNIIIEDEEELKLIITKEIECFSVLNITKNVNILYDVALDLMQIYNISIIDALEKFKQACESNLQIKRPLTNTNFIKDLFGENSIRYKNKIEINKKFISCSFEKFSLSYEDKELAKQEFNKKYGSNNISHLKEKFNISEKEAELIIKERCKKSRDTFNSKPEEEKIKIYKSRGLTLKKYVDEYGEEIGTIIYKQHVEKRRGVGSLKYFIDKFGDDEGKIKYIENNKKKNYLSIDFWINRGYTEFEAVERIKNILDKRPNFSLEYAIEKYGKEEGSLIWKKRQDKWQETLTNKTEDEKNRINKSKGLPKEKYIEKHGIDKYEENLKNRIKKLSPVSKISLKFFIPLYKELRKNGIIEKEDVKWGIGKRLEYFIKTKDKIFFYDFTIEKLKIIIEFNGLAWHPKEGNYDWKHPFGLTYEEVINNDKIKKNVAIEKGFDVFYVWEDEDFEFIREELLQNIINTVLIKNLKKL